MHPLAFAVLLAATTVGCAADVAGQGSTGTRPLADLLVADDGGTLSYAGAADLALGKAGPPYPIVLVHGMAGFRSIGPIEYFYGIPEALRKDGHDVWVSRQDPINDSEVRGAQVLAFVEEVLAATGKARVNLVGHSQGGFDVRYVASRLGERVATATTIATPHGGDPVADLALGSGPGAQRLLAALLELYGAASGFDSNARAQVTGLTTAGAKAFGERHPDDRRVAYFSLAGRSVGSDGGGDCWAASRPGFVSRWDAGRDPLDPLLLPFGSALDNLAPRPVHDGLVPVGSARYGTFLGCVPADHLDEVNQLFGDRPGPGNGFDATEMYRGLAEWMVGRGY